MNDDEVEVGEEDEIVAWGDNSSIVRRSQLGARGRVPNPPRSAQTKERTEITLESFQLGKT